MHRKILSVLPIFIFYRFRQYVEADRDKKKKQTKKMQNHNKLFFLYLLLDQSQTVLKFEVKLPINSPMRFVKIDKIWPVIDNLVVSGLRQCYILLFIRQDKFLRQVILRRKSIQAKPAGSRLATAAMFLWICPGAKPRRLGPPLVTCFSVIP